MKWPTVMCDKCRKPVDLMVWSEDYLTAEQVLRVKCHGEWDEMRLRLETLSHDQIEQLNSATGVAFTTKEIEHAGSDGR